MSPNLKKKVCLYACDTHFNGIACTCLHYFCKIGTMLCAQLYALKRKSLPIYRPIKSIQGTPVNFCSPVMPVEESIKFKTIILKIMNKVP